MTARAASCLCLVVAATGVWYAAIIDEGDPLGLPVVPLLVVGCAGVASAAFGLTREQTKGTHRFAQYVALLIPAYIALQLLPVPIGLLEVVDPARAELSQAFGAITSIPQLQPVSIVPEKTWAHLARVVCYATMFLVVSGVASRGQIALWGVVSPLLALGTVETILALNQQRTGSPVLGTYLNRNHLSGLLEILLPFATLLGMTLAHRYRFRKHPSQFLPIAASAAFVLAAAMLAAIALSLSRMGFVSALVSLLVMAAVSLRHPLHAPTKWTGVLAATAAIVLAVMVMAPADLILRYGELVTDPTAGGRWSIVRDAFTLFTAYPLVGSGLGTVSPALLRYQTHGFEYAWSNVHNDYVEVLATTGVIGFLLFTLLIAAVLLRAVRAALEHRSSRTRYIALACVGSMTAILVHGLVDFNMFVPSNAMALSWVLGLALALPDANTFGQSERRK